MQNNPTSDDMDSAESSVQLISEKPRVKKRVLEPKGKPQPKDEDSYVTPGGMDITVSFDKQYGLYFIETSGGIVPKDLQGKFTEEKRARHAVEMYLRKNPRYRE